TPVRPPWVDERGSTTRTALRLLPGGVRAAAPSLEHEQAEEERDRHRHRHDRGEGPRSHERTEAQRDRCRGHQTTTEERLEDELFVPERRISRGLGLGVDHAYQDQTGGGDPEGLTELTDAALEPV